MLDTPKIAQEINESADPSVLQTLGMDGVSVAVWQRSLPERLTAWLDSLPTDQLPTMRLTLPAAKVADAVRAACHVSGAAGQVDALAQEVARIAEHAASVLAAPILEVRLSVSTGQPCPKWHVDAVPGRLLCTLRGPGTEFGPVNAHGDVQTLHRSPPATDGMPRLLSVIDPLDDRGVC